MADTDISITAGSGTKIDTRTVGAGVDEHRQVVVVGDPTTAANVASADATNGLDVDVTRVQGVVTEKNDQPTRTTGTITTSASTVGPATVTNYASSLITINGTYAGVTIVVEGSDDGSVWYRLMGPLALVVANWSAGYLINHQGYTQLRVRSTAYTSGTMNVAINPQAAAGFKQVGPFQSAMNDNGLLAAVQYMANALDDWVPFQTANSPADTANGVNFLATAPWIYNGVTFDRHRGAPSADGQARTGISASGSMMFNGSTWDRVKGDTTNGLDVDVTRLPSAATATTSQVADNAASVTILAANAGRLGAYITNDSSARLYIRLGAAAASTTNYSFSLAQHEMWEPSDSIMYTGEIRGIWATDPGDGGAKVTELTT